MVCRSSSLSRAIIRRTPDGSRSTSAETACSVLKRKCGLSCIRSASSRAVGELRLQLRRPRFEHHRLALPRQIAKIEVARVAGGEHGQIDEQLIEEAEPEDRVASARTRADAATERRPGSAIRAQIHDQVDRDGDRDSDQQQRADPRAAIASVRSESAAQPEDDAA